MKDKPQTSGGLLGFAVLGALLFVLYWTDREVTQGAVTEYLAYFRSFAR